MYYLLLFNKDLTNLASFEVDECKNMKMSSLFNFIGILTLQSIIKFIPVPIQRHLEATIFLKHCFCPTLYTFHVLYIRCIIIQPFDEWLELLSRISMNTDE